MFEESMRDTTIETLKNSPASFPTSQRSSENRHQALALCSIIPQQSGLRLLS